jgi:hypothetical protein
LHADQKAQPQTTTICCTSIGCNGFCTFLPTLRLQLPIGTTPSCLKHFLFYGTVIGKIPSHNSDFITWKLRRTNCAKNTLRSTECFDSFGEKSGYELQSCLIIIGCDKNNELDFKDEIQLVVFIFTS